VLGITSPSGKSVLYVRTDESLPTLRDVALHEAGHAWAFARLNNAGVRRWCDARGCDPPAFRSARLNRSDGWSDPAAAEDWAASWDVCHGGAYLRSYIGLGIPEPTLCALQNRLVRY
jgi:hypothetical protein